MTKQELINAVLENPAPASESGKLECYGGYDAGHGVLRYECINSEGEMAWKFCRNSARGRSFVATDKFILETIEANWRKLVSYYDLKSFDFRNIEKRR